MAMAKTIIMEAIPSVRSSQTSFEEQLKSAEKDAREKYVFALKEMHDVRLPAWFNGLLERRIIPALIRMGFDESLAWALFKMAAPAWELMGPITDQQIWFHPVLMRSIREIRKGILSKASKDLDRLLLMSGMGSQDLLSWARENATPERLFSLLEDVALPWIVLPRAYDHLEAYHSRYFLGYLNYLDAETSGEFKKILSRIIIEFLGSYTLKFLTEKPLKNRMIHVLCYGYEALFWRNLRNPPSGLEDAGIFEHFLSWMKMVCHRVAPPECEIAKAIARMEEAKKQTFPVFNAFGLVQDRHDDMASFLVTLRHGYPGIDASGKYFGLGGSLLKNATDGRLPYSNVPVALSQLFREIQYRYSRETSRTQASIRRFLIELRASYDLKGTYSIRVERRPPEEMAFVAPRVCEMIHELTDWIHLNQAAVLPNSSFTGL